MSGAEKLLERLDRVRARGQGQWFASCPTSAHKYGDRSRGLSVKELSDGRILLHCFAGCPLDDVVSSIGLTLSDLFPNKGVEGKRERPSWPLRDLLDIIRHEALVAHMGAEKLSCGEVLHQEDIERLALAATRIRRALEVGGVHGNHR